MRVIAVEEYRANFKGFARTSKPGFLTFCCTLLVANEYTPFGYYWTTGLQLCYDMKFMSQI